jgi:hypothetical protein
VLGCPIESLSHSVCESGGQKYAVHAQTTVTFGGVISTVDGGDVGVAPVTSITMVETLAHRGGTINPGSTAFYLHVIQAHDDAMATTATATTALTEIGGQTFTPGTYKFNSAINIAFGTYVTLDGAGDYLFQAGSTLVTAADTFFILLNGAKAENILWALGTAVTLGARSVLEGSILAKTAITFGAQSELRGCALAQSAITFETAGSVNLNSQPFPACTTGSESLSESVCQNFAVHARTTVTFAAGGTIDGGDVGVSPGTSITGSETVTFQNGASISADSTAFAFDVAFAHSAAIAHRADAVYMGMAIELGGQTYTPGTYRSGSSMNLALSSFVTLDGEGDVNSKFVFQAGTTLITDADTYVNLINGAKAENVLWAVGSAATLGANSIIQGSILAGTSITFGAASEVHGCALALAAVTFPSAAFVYLLPNEPSATAQLSGIPLSSPSTSAEPSGSPSKGSNEPSASAQPSGIPSSSPSNSAAPSGSLSSSPSTSLQPSGSPLSVTPSTDCTNESLSHSVCESGGQMYAVHSQTTVTFGAVISTIDGGNVGVSPGTSITMVTAIAQKGGTITTESAAFASHVLSAHAAALALLPTTSRTSLQIGGRTFTQGVHKFASEIQIGPAGAIVTLDGEGDPNSEFVFIAGSSMTTAAETVVLLINGAKAKNVLWVLGSAATLGARSVLEGSILAGTAITVGAQMEVRGCTLAKTDITFSSAGTINLRSQGGLSSSCSKLPDYLVSSLSQGACQNFAVHARTAITFAAGDIIDGGLVGVSPGNSITGTAGVTFLNDGAISTNAASTDFAFSVAFAHSAAIAHRVDTTYLGITAPIGGRTFTPGTYRSDTTISMAASEIVTLDGQDDPNSIFFFQAGSTLGTGASSQIKLINRAKAENVIWSLGSAGTIGIGSIIQGSILAGTAITMGANAEVYGCTFALSAITVGIDGAIYLPP